MGKAASINPHLMRCGKAEAGTGEFDALREAVHYLSGVQKIRRRKGQVNGQIKNTLLFCPRRVRRLLITDYFMTILKYYRWKPNVDSFFFPT